MISTRRAPIPSRLICRRINGPARCRIAGDLAHDIASADGVINATQMGMRGFPGCPVPVAALKASHWAADVIYTPLRPRSSRLRPPWVRACSNGSGMSVHTGGRRFPVPDRRHARSGTAAPCVRDRRCGARRGGWRAAT